MRDVNQVLDNIKMEFQTSRPNTKSILKSLIDLRAKGKSQQLSDSEFYSVVGETFKLNPDFFMNELYQTFRNKMVKIIGVKNLMDMEKYIIEKFSLYEGEQILYECKGNIKLTEIIVKESGKFTSQPLDISVSSGNLFFTNYRIIANGLFSIRGGQSLSFFWDLFPSDLGDALYYFTGRSRRAEEKQHFIDGSIIQELPCYGYEFPIKNHSNLRQNNHLYIVTYHIRIDNRKCVFTIKPLKSSKRDKSIIIMHDIFNILRRGANEILDFIKKVNDTEKLDKKKQRIILSILKELHESEEFADLSNSEFFDIVGETFKLDPDFFMAFVYPKMMSWKIPSFLSVKEEIKTFVDKLSKEPVPPKPEQDDDSIKFVKE